MAKGEEVGAVESVKAASEVERIRVEGSPTRVSNQVYSPLTGTVVASNEAVEEKPGLVNSSPEKDGWLFRVLLQDEQEVKDQPIRGRSHEEFSPFYRWQV